MGCWTVDQERYFPEISQFLGDVIKEGLFLISVLNLIKSIHKIPPANIILTNENDDFSLRSGMRQGYLFSQLSEALGVLTTGTAAIR